MGRWHIIGNDRKQEFGEQSGCRLKEAQKLAGILQEYLAEAGGIKTAYDRFASDFQYGRYAEAVEQASLCGEKLTGKLRRMALDSAVNPEKQRDYGRKLIKSHGISIQYEERILTVKLPFLLPHRKHKYTDYIYQPLFLAMENWCGERMQEGLEVPAYGKAVICFCHIYEREQSGIKIRDHDNIEEKQVVDALGTFFLESDGGFYLDTYHTSCMGSGDRTEVCLMERTRFPDWIQGLDMEKWISKNKGVPDQEKSTG